MAQIIKREPVKCQNVACPGENEAVIFDCGCVVTRTIKSHMFNPPCLAGFEFGQTRSKRCGQEGAPEDHVARIPSNG